MDEDYICQHLLVKYDIQLLVMPLQIDQTVCFFEYIRKLGAEKNLYPLIE